MIKGRAKQLLENDWIFGGVLSLVLLLICYPEVIGMQTFIMAATGDELNDPAVSPLNFIPGFRAFRYELFHHQNILWTSLRGLGYPMLANEVQIAPLFPLTWIWIWVSEQYFWNVLVLSRLFLISLGSFMVARRLFQFTRWAAFFFVLTFAFGTYHLRWNNHPWQNGLLSGIWYLYFLEREILSSTLVWGKARLANLLLISLAAYSLMTSGFPEGALLGGLFAWLVLLPRLAIALKKKELALFSFGTDFCLSHLLAFGLAGPQIFALVEILGVNAAQYRMSAGLAQYEGWEIFSHMLTRLTAHRPGGIISHFFCLVPSFYFICGILSFLKGEKRSIWDFSAIFTLIFWILKCFPIWPAFNVFFASLPVFSGTWFIIYFFSLPIFFFAYFGARGFERKLTPTRAVLAGSIVLYLFYGAASVADSTGSRTVKAAYIFIAFLIFVYVHFSQEYFKSREKAVGWVFCVLLLLEFISVRHVLFLRFNQPGYAGQYSHKLPDEVAEILKRHHLKPWEVREESDGGMLSSAGIASINNGSAAIIPPRLTSFWPAIFTTMEGWGAAMPVKKGRHPFAWQLISGGLLVTQESHEKVVATPNRKFHLLGASTEGFRVYQDSSVLPRSYLATECVVVKDWNESLSRIDHGEYNLGKVYIENPSVDESEFCRKFQGKLQAVAILRDLGSELDLSEIQGPAILVLNDNVYPGWKVLDRLSNTEFSIHPANTLFRSIFLPEVKKYRLSFQYIPPWLALSKKLIGSALGLLLILVLSAFWTERVRSPKLKPLFEF